MHNTYTCTYIHNRYTYMYFLHIPCQYGCPNTLFIFYPIPIRQFLGQPGYLYLSISGSAGISVLVKLNYSSLTFWKGVSLKEQTIPSWSLKYVGTTIASTSYWVVLTYTWSINVPFSVVGCVTS